MAKYNPGVRHGDLLYFEDNKTLVLVISEPDSDNLHVMRESKRVTPLESPEDLRAFTIIMNIFDIVKEVDNAS